MVLDFDGTLIDSNRLKYDAYFNIMPGQDPALIKQVLDTMFEASRYDIIAEILRRYHKKKPGYGNRNLESEVRELAGEYNNIVLLGACTCPEIPGALEILNWLSGRNIPVYVSSTTPEVSLKQIIETRGWSSFFTEVCGFPATKEATLQRIIKEQGVKSGQILVVGDGESDRRSAEAMKTGFVPVIDGRFPVQEVKALITG